jgi:hypothetical protein
MQWEARSALRYGSKHEGYFASKDAAEAFAREHIAKTGNVGKIETVINGVVYYTEFETDD